MFISPLYMYADFETINEIDKPNLIWCAFPCAALPASVSLVVIDTLRDQSCPSFHPETFQFLQIFSRFITNKNWYERIPKLFRKIYHRFFRKPAKIDFIK